MLSCFVFAGKGSWSRRLSVHLPGPDPGISACYAAFTGQGGVPRVGVQGWDGRALQGCLYQVGLEYSELFSWQSDKNMDKKSFHVKLDENTMDFSYDKVIRTCTYSFHVNKICKYKYGCSLCCIFFKLCSKVLIFPGHIISTVALQDQLKLLKK